MASGYDGFTGRKKIYTCSGKVQGEGKGKEEHRIQKGSRGMGAREQLMQGLSDAGCSTETAERIGLLYEAGRYGEVLYQLKKERCVLIDQMHESQRRVDRMDFLIRNQEKAAE